MRITEDDMKIYELYRSNAAVLEEAYKYYDSELIVENLSFRGLGKFFHKVLNWSEYVCVYADDEKGIAQITFFKGKKIYKKAIITDGYMAIRNLSGSYDVHHFWRAK